MFKRTRRSTLCRVEQLEGRASASTVVDSAVVIGVVGNEVVHLRGYTTDVRAGERLDIRAAEQGTHPTTVIHGHTVTAVQSSGAFFGAIRAERPWLIGGELTVEVSVIRPESNPSTSLLVTEHIQIKLA
jgi:hypothetical protein